MVIRAYVLALLEESPSSMRIILLLLFILCSCSLPAQTNVYHPFPSANAVWNTEYFLYWCHFWPYVHVEKYSYAMAGDTTIGATVYHKIQVPYVYMVDSCLGNFPMNYPRYWGAIREDSALHAVYFVSNNDSTEQLLYDFSLQLNDTVRGYLVSTCGLTTVSAVDSILINGSYRKRWYWSEQWTGHTTQAVEGIGSLTGLLDPACELIDGPSTVLSCFKENGTVFYSDLTYGDSSCDIIDNTLDFQNENFTVTFFPNPFHNSAKLGIGKKEMGNGNYILKIYDTLGILVREEQILNLTPDGHRDYIVHRAGLNEGLYFFEVTSAGHQATGKFVIE